MSSQLYHLMWCVINICSCSMFTVSWPWTFILSIKAAQMNSCRWCFLLVFIFNGLDFLEWSAYHGHALIALLLGCMWFIINRNVIISFRVWDYRKYIKDVLFSQPGISGQMLVQIWTVALLVVMPSTLTIWSFFFLRWDMFVSLNFNPLCMPAAFQIKCNRRRRASELRRHFWLCHHAITPHSKSWRLIKVTSKLCYYMEYQDSMF